MKAKEATIEIVECEFAGNPHGGKWRVRIYDPSGMMWSDECCPHFPTKKEAQEWVKGRGNNEMSEIIENNQQVLSEIKTEMKLTEELQKELQGLAWKYEGEGMEQVHFQMALLNSALSLTFQIHDRDALAHIHGMIAAHLENLYEEEE